MQMILPIENEFEKRMVATAISAGISELITIPVCTLKTVYQTQHYNKIRDAMSHIYKSAGIKGYYSASPMAVISQVGSTTTKYSIYHALKTHRATRDNDILNNSINGIVGGVVGGFLVHPIDVVKNYQQRNKSYIQDFKKIGVRLIYRGHSQTIAKNIVLYSLLYPTYDFYKSKELSPFMASTLTTISTTGVLHPIDLCRVKMMAGQSPFVNTKLKDYYKGISINLMRTMPHFVITMTGINYLMTN